mmetsp:Transcript_17531/g.52501  ORF Transcript_17531/g.52501 Transcript_17531/m.52501 type:complete len:386 (+) Transcript_17531:229-1386(+)
MAASSISDDRKTLRAIWYENGEPLRLLDQLALPSVSRYVAVHDHKEGHSAIASMLVRGAPAIAITAALSLAVELARSIANEDAHHADPTSPLTDGVPATADEARARIENALEFLKTSRPTAVNLFEAAARLSALVKACEGSPREIFELFIGEAEAMLEQDVACNRRLGAFGADCIPGEQVRVLTHCNTGSLATAGYGTALGVIRALQEQGRLEHAYCTETRPYNQGSRLTAYELVYEKIPATLLCDSMVTALLEELLAKGQKLDAIVVGADRVVANGDTANKIGTLQLATLAKVYGVPFYVASPTTTLDVDTATGADIVIEQRSGHEVRYCKEVQLAPEEVAVWNPAFDVTPARLITGIVTENGVIPPSSDASGKVHFDVAGFLA